MQAEIPKSKLQRSVASGKTAARVGGKVLKYLAKKPFLSKEKKQKARSKMEQESADILFKGLSMLKGTALKIAQQLSLELDIFPETVRIELEKSYHQVPPINRALVSKIVRNAFGQPYNEVFGSFDTKAFAAASLGQVHRARSREGRELAVKVQYPGIGATIRNDIQLVKSMLRPLPDYHLIRPSIMEIEERLAEEIDYVQEAENMRFFKEHIKMEGIKIPDTDDKNSCKTVLSSTYMPGLPLDEWIKTGPDQNMRDNVAQRLNDLFLNCLYEYGTIHADPNPGNFIIRDDLTVGVIDFGCIKQMDDAFVQNYRKLPRAIIKGDRDTYIRLLKGFGVLKAGIGREAEDKVFETAYKLGAWFGNLYQPDFFDFGAHPDFMAQGKAHFTEIFRLRSYLDSNPEFVYLDRTRYGLIRIFESMKARVRIRNSYEWE